MKTRQITTKTKPETILKLFRECPQTASVNLKTDFGYIYLVGGILNKLQGTDHYIASKGSWVRV